MKYILLLSILWICSCNEYNPDNKKYVVLEKGGRGEVDSMKFFRDTIIIYRSYWISNDTILMRLIPSNDTVKIPQYKWK